MASTSAGRGAGMGSRSHSLPCHMSAAPSASGAAHSGSPVDTAGLQRIVELLPMQYVMATTSDDRYTHVRLLAELRASDDVDHDVKVSWTADVSPHGQPATATRLHLVFTDRRGSLGVISNVLSEFGMNIVKASVFCTSDGFAIDAFSVDKFDPVLAQALSTALHAALKVVPVGVSSAQAEAPPAPRLGGMVGAPISALAGSGSGDGSGSMDLLNEWGGMALGSETDEGSSISMKGGALDPMWSEDDMLRWDQGQFASLHVKRILDEGSSSTVWEGDWAGVRVVVKVLRQQPCAGQDALNAFLSEVEIWSMLRHPSICSFLGTCMHDARPAIVLEYMQGGTLHDMLHNTGGGGGGGGGSSSSPASSFKKGKPASHRLLARILVEVAAGISYLHANQVMHRDIKTANVLLDETQHAKVADFGISTRFGREDYTAETGTYRHMAPEVIVHKPYDYKCDVYSYAILLWEVTHGEVPFSGYAPLQAAFAVAIEHQRPAITLKPPLDAYATLIAACWDGEPSARPDMDRVTKSAAEIAAAIDAAPEAASPRSGSLRQLTGALASKLSFS